MARTLTLEMPEKEYDKLKHFLEGAVAEMRESRKQMREDQAKINRLKTESKKISDKTQKILDELESTWRLAA